MNSRPSPARSRDFELSSVLGGMCYQDSVKRQCSVHGLLKMFFYSQ
jgi:hypothetical protein